MKCPSSPWVCDIWGVERSITLVFLGWSAKLHRNDQVDSLHLRSTTLRSSDGLQWQKSLYRSHSDGNLLRLGVRQSIRWHKGWIRGGAKWIPDVPQKTHLWVPTSDHRFGRTAFDQSNNSQSNVERTWKTLAYAICTEMSHTQLYQKL